MVDTNRNPGDALDDETIKSLDMTMGIPTGVEQNTSQIYFADDLIAIYTAFRDQVFNPQSVLYPSCGFDASPAKVFKNTMFVDIEQQ